MNKKNYMQALIVCALIFAAGFLPRTFAQTTPAAARSWYVAVDGNDDNNGRSPDEAFKTVGKAFSAAAASNVKTITVVGEIGRKEISYRKGSYSREEVSGSFPSEGIGAAEILLTGIEIDPAQAKTYADYETALAAREVMQENYNRLKREYDTQKRQLENQASSNTRSTQNSQKAVDNAEKRLAQYTAALAELKNNLPLSDRERQGRDLLAQGKAAIAEELAVDLAKAAGQKNPKNREKAEAAAKDKAAKNTAKLAELETYVQNAEAQAAGRQAGPIRDLEQNIQSAAADVEKEKAGLAKFTAEGEEIKAKIAALVEPTLPEAPPKPDVPEGYPSRVFNTLKLGEYMSEKAPAAKIRIENLRFAQGDTGDLRIYGNINLTLGKGVVIESGDLDIHGTSTVVTMQADAAVLRDKVIITGSQFIMKDNARISGRGMEARGDALVNGNPLSVTIQDNARIENGGVSLYDVSFTMKGKASISGCEGGGISAQSSVLTLQDDVSVTGNGYYGAKTVSDKGGGYRTSVDGGGIRLNGSSLTLKGNALVTGNRATKGGGIYFATGGNSPGVTPYQQPPTGKPLTRIFGENAMLTIQDNAKITGNEAKEGGGIYVESGGDYYTAGFTLTDSAARFVAGNKVSISHTLTGVVMNGGAISGNKADYGAGVYTEKALERGVPQYTPPPYSTLSYQDLGSDGWGFTRGAKKVVIPAFVLNGGSITGNEAQFVGGGVYVKAKGAFAQGKGTVSGNKAGDGEGEDVYTP